MRCGRIAVALIAITLPVGAADGEPDREGHREIAVPPPDTSVTRESLPRSEAVPVLRGLHQSVQVNVDSMQNNIVGDAANEPSMAVDPTNPDYIVIGWRQFDTVTSSFRQAGIAHSHDGGATWTFSGVLDPGQFRSDPVLAVNSLGDFFYYSLASSLTTDYFISTDKGVSWSGPISSPGGDKNWHTIDVSGGIGDGHIYPIWNSQYTCCAGGTDFSRSTDGAMTFEGPYRLRPHPKWGTNDVGPDGELYIVGATLDHSGHLILRSDDAKDGVGRPSFALDTAIDLGGTTSTSGTPNPGGLLGHVWVAVDRSTGASRGNVYVLSSVNPPGPDPLDVHFIGSEDGGQTWSAPLRVNDDPVGNAAYQWFGTLSVAPDGRIDVAWNDTRAGPPTISELYYAYSIDAGGTFSAGLPVSPAFDSTVGYPAQNKIGDYYHMISDATGASIAYAATFNGEQDIYFLRVGDCNANGTHDSADISSTSSPDVNTNGIPDECEPDCNGNGVPDPADLSTGSSDDCNGNRVPDECDISSGSSHDCDDDGILDDCDLLFDMEVSQGFTVGAADDSATSGVWTRVNPVGTVAQPEDDHTQFPGASCYVTGQGVVGGAATDSDVDGGKTTLLSPLLGLDGLVEPWIGYWRWYSNHTGGLAGADTFVVDISNDGGGNWTNVEVVGPAGSETLGGWFFHIFRVSDLVVPTANVQLRFVASDLGGESTVEAAIDDVVLVDCASCALTIPGEVDNLTLDLSGTVAALEWDAEAGATAYRVYRGTQRDASDLACFLPEEQGTSATDDGLVPGTGELFLYLTSAVNCAGESTLGHERSASVLCP